MSTRLLPGKDPSGLPVREFRGVDKTPTVTSVVDNFARAAGSKNVTITGQNFYRNRDGSAPLVTFGGIAGTNVIVVNSTTITVDTPSVSEAQLVDVSVTIDNRTGTLTSAFSFVAAQILSVKPAFGPISGGTDVLLTGVNFELGSSVTFDGALGVNVVFIDSEHIRVTTPNHAVGFVDVVLVGP